MLEQHIRDAKASLETRALAAMSKNVDATLLNEVAEEIARLENTILAEEQVLTNQEASRDAVEKAVTAEGQRIAQFEQQLEVVKATEAMLRTQQAVTTSTVGAASNVSTAAESLKRLQTRQAERRRAAGKSRRWTRPGRKTGAVRYWRNQQKLRPGCAGALAASTRRVMRFMWIVKIYQRHLSSLPGLRVILL